MTTISFCICTKDRPNELRRVLLSIARGTALPNAVLVSDDGSNPDAIRELCQEFPFVRYFAGPLRGLCANRNAIVARVETDYVALIDDDGIVSADFVESLYRILPGLDRYTIVTGDVLEYGGRTTPKNPSFWGHFVRVPIEGLKTINLNCNCFPRSAFSSALFDESLVYGYEDMDLCAHLLREGYKILYVPALWNEHVPPPRLKEIDSFRYRYTQQARFRTSMRRYLVWERKPLFALLYLIMAPLHRAFHDFRTGRINDIPKIPSDILSASLHALRSLNEA